MGKEEGADGDGGGLSLPLNPPGIQPRLCMPIICFSHCSAQVYFLVLSLSPCCCELSHFTKPKLPGVRHNEFPGKRNVGTHVDCWDANKVTAVSSI